jgi:hypothetical protein
MLGSMVNPKGNMIQLSLQVIKQMPQRVVRFIRAIAMVLVMLWSGCQTLSAGDLFRMSVSPGGSEVGSSDLLNLVDKIINGKDEFAFFAGPGLPYVGTLQYGNVPNAINFAMNGPRTSADLNIPSIGFTRTFVGVDQGDIENQIEAFLKKDGADVWAKFMKAMAAQSLVAVSDGNPNSTTAFAAAQAYENYGMTYAQTREEMETTDEGGSRMEIGVMADVGAFSANGIQGKTYRLPMYARFKLTERVGLNVDIPLSYIDIAGAKVFGIGMGVGVPIKVVPKTKESPWYWQAAPFVGANVAASMDMLAGGMIINGGINSVLAYDFGPCTLSMGNHISLHEGMPLTIDSYRFDPGVSQQILKNGLKLDVPVGRRWIFDAYAIHTKFLAPAAIDQYYTIGGEVGYRLMRKGGAAKKGGGYLKLGLYTDVGDDYSAAHARFGSGWKF